MDVVAAAAAAVAAEGGGDATSRGRVRDTWSPFREPEFVIKISLTLYKVRGGGSGGGAGQLGF